MFEDNIITLEDIQGYKPLSKNTDAGKKVDPFIQEAQEFELRPFMSDEFYAELVTQFKAGFPDSTYSDLFNGSTYTNGGKTYTNPGIKPMLVYYAYARYLKRSNTNSTAFGMVGKNNPDSTPLTEKTLSRLVDDSMSGAKAYENRVRMFLDCNSRDYPLYTCTVVNRKTGGLRISSAGGNSRRRTQQRFISSSTVESGIFGDTFNDTFN